MYHSSPNWKSPATREVWIAVIEEWDDPRAIANEWLEMCTFDDACDNLASQLRTEFRRQYASGFGDGLMRALVRPAFRQIDFHQVARFLLEQYGECQETAEDEGDGGSKVAS
ncbi:MAG TPA: hypothetical protein VK395_07650 [Gemmataceae bacterium]|nr:hypothetical protein [Gemmataceae bacterium]